MKVHVGALSLAAVNPSIACRCVACAIFPVNQAKCAHGSENVRVGIMSVIAILNSHVASLQQRKQVSLEAGIQVHAVCKRLGLWTKH